MSTYDRSLLTPSACKSFARLAAVMLFVTVCVANAQDNANNANGNAGNTNVNANRSGNANANADANANAMTTANGNANRNQNGNQNDNQNGNQNGNSNSIIEARRGAVAGTYWFPFVVTAIFAAVLIPFGMVITRAIRFSRSTFNSPLGLPDGSLRAILAYMLVAFLGFFVYASVLSFSEFKPPDFLLGIVATVIGFYFGSRTSEDRNAAAPRTGTVQGTVADKAGAPAGGASIELSQPDGKKLTQKADANGKYKFDNVPAGDYDIQASSPTHGPSNPTKAKVTAGASLTVELKLT